ncbi:MAG TPA: dihydroorotase [Actinomycetota bacterium]|nr:dihydroorotase [Actinomycetota bacterium]
MSELLLTGGHLIDPASNTDGLHDVLIVDGVIAEIGPSIQAPGSDVLDVSGLVVSPGFVDLHVHLREPGREDEETVYSGCAGAALGGFTALQSMPNTDPVCDNAAVAEKIVAEAARVGLARVVPAGSITKNLDGQHMSPFGEMVESSAAVRMFTDDGKGVQDARLLRRAMEYLRGFDAICAEHCDEASLSEGGQMNEGEVSDLLGLRGIPAEAEEIALARDLKLAKLTGVRFHALHVSTAGSVELIRRAKQEGLRVTAEVTPHHLSLTDAELTSFDTDFKVNPPLRSAADVEALRAGLLDGTIDAIATDHAPHSPEEKEAEFELSPPGMLGLETALGVLIGELVPDILSLSQLIRVLSTNPARILGLDEHGNVSVGARANLAIFDPAEAWTVDPESFASPSRNTPWKGRELTGKVKHTIFDGHLVVQGSQLLDIRSAV